MFGKVNEDSFQTLFPIGTPRNKNNSSSSSSSSTNNSDLESDFSLKRLTRLDFSLSLNDREEYSSANNLNPVVSSHSDFSSLLKSLDRKAAAAAGNSLLSSSSSSIPSSNTSSSLDPAQQAKTNTSRYKTELCRPYQENGTCKYGEKCQFAHGKLELRTVSRHPKYKTDLCRTYHSVGFCPYGPRCHFIHNLDESRPNTKEASQGSQVGISQAQPNGQQLLGNGMPPLPMFSGKDYLSDAASSPGSSSSSTSDFEGEVNSDQGSSFSPTSPSRLPVFSTISKF